MPYSTNGAVIHLEVDPPAAVERYVSFMLIEMSLAPTANRVLRRSEALPPVVVKQQTAQPAPLEEVLNKLKIMSNLKPKTYRKPVDGTITVTIGEFTQPPFKFLCHFDDKSDVCCTIRMERPEAEKDG